METTFSYNIQSHNNRVHNFLILMVIISVFSREDVNHWTLVVSIGLFLGFFNAMVKTLSTTEEWIENNEVHTYVNTLIQHFHRDVEI